VSLKLRGREAEELHQHSYPGHFSVANPEKLPYLFLASPLLGDKKMVKGCLDVHHPVALVASSAKIIVTAPPPLRNSECVVFVTYSLFFIIFTQYFPHYRTLKRE
jgi:hypothetical protein